MHFTAYILRTHVYVGNICDGMELLLYDGRKIFARGPSEDGKDFLRPGDLVEFSCDHNGADAVPFEDLPADRVYRLSRDWVARITNEETIRTFFIGVEVLGAGNGMPRKIVRLVRRLKKKFLELTLVFRRRPITP